LLSIFVPSLSWQTIIPEEILTAEKKTRKEDCSRTQRDRELSFFGHDHRRQRLKVAIRALSLAHKPVGVVRVVLKQPRPSREQRERLLLQMLAVALTSLTTATILSIITLPSLLVLLVLERCEKPWCELERGELRSDGERRMRIFEAL
jgi:hypothetical protein